jgi:hypothetical protein
MVLSGCLGLNKKINRLVYINNRLKTRMCFIEFKINRVNTQWYLKIDFAAMDNSSKFTMV